MSKNTLFKNIIIVGIIINNIKYIFITIISHKSKIK
jgi:hypothetical protein